MSSELQLDVCCLSCCGVTSGERHEGKAGMVLFAGKTVLSMPERFVCNLVQKGAIYKYSSFLFPRGGRTAAQRRSS